MEIELYWSNNSYILPTALQPLYCHIASFYVLVSVSLTTCLCEIVDISKPVVGYKRVLVMERGWLTNVIKIGYKGVVASVLITKRYFESDFSDKDGNIRVHVSIFNMFYIKF